MDYASTAYRPVNLDRWPTEPGTPGMNDPDRWQPLWLPTFVGQSGVLMTNRPEFVTPEWGASRPSHSRPTI